MDCIFCSITGGNLPSKTIFENEYVKVIMNIYPLANGHLLIIPKKHFHNDCGSDIDDTYLIEINKVANLMNKLVMDKLKIKGLSLAVNFGDKPEIKHYHVHLIPDDKSPLKDIDEVFELLKK